MSLWLLLYATLLFRISQNSNVMKLSTVITSFCVNCGGSPVMRALNKWKYHMELKKKTAVGTKCNNHYKLFYSPCNTWGMMNLSSFMLLSFVFWFSQNMPFWNSFDKPWMWGAYCFSIFSHTLVSLSFPGKITQHVGANILSCRSLSHLLLWIDKALFEPLSQLDCFLYKSSVFLSKLKKKVTFKELKTQTELLKNFIHVHL